MSTTYKNRDAKRQRRRRKATRQLSPREVVKRTAWLTWPRLYWAGGSEPELASDTISPMARVLALRLATARPGLYAIQVARDVCSPELRLY